MSTLSPWAAGAGQQLRELLTLGRSRGSLCVSDIRAAVDVDDLSPEVLAQVRMLLDREGISLVEDDPVLDEQAAVDLADVDEFDVAALAARALAAEVAGDRTV